MLKEAIDDYNLYDWDRPTSVKYKLPEARNI